MDVAELERAKAGRTVTVVLPALDEEETVGKVVDTIHPLLGGLVDELVVLDSGSTDDTVARARAAGARTISREEAVPGLPPVPGKGEVLWRSIAATSGDLIAFVDSDLINPDPASYRSSSAPCCSATESTSSKVSIVDPAGQWRGGRLRRWPGHRTGRATPARRTAAGTDVCAPTPRR